ncbi:MFS transporter [Allobranchiibius sp. GilTou73]|uniref:MFS transporter n=1 Tax=Allobranchiibius sp. GilTou73 TaxID=2904523 RepID=UPI001F26CB9E|nr:MFS transporter [Allobranchiibius sp. GilTou73]UIJ36252.1 MFS transporter [Allobranchiibius sp. GilTou73]
MPTAAPAETTATGGSQLSRPLVLLMALAAGVSVANLYYSQPLLDLIGRDLHIASGAVGILVTVTQLGYAAGLLFVLPLGDLLERRRLIVGMTLATAVALVLTAFAQNEAWLLVMLLIVGLLSVVAQVVVPLAAALASDDDRGSVVGTVMSGLLIGILLARTLAGLLAEVGGWRSVYLVAAALVLLLAAGLWRGLPDSPPTVRTSYGGLLGSVARLVRTEPILRRRMLYGALNFAQFSVLWTAITGLLSGSPYHYSEGVIGLFGLAGVAGALAAPLIGRLADGGHQLYASVGAALLFLVSWALLAGGRASLIALLIGVVLLDLACQSLQVTNQSRIYSLAGDARARVNAAYMTAYFIGGAAGSWVATRVASTYHWSGVCLLGAGLGVVLLAAVVVGESSLRRLTPRTT